MNDPPAASRSIPAGARLALRKQLGQHHLRDARLCRPVIDFLQPAERPTIEVGSGGGVLTRALLEAGAEVVALDVDLAWLIEGRRSLQTGEPRPLPVCWLAADAMQFGWRTVDGEWLIAGNLPYNVATPIIRVILEESAAQRMCFLVQREVGERMTSGPGSRRYGLLSLIVAWWARGTVLAVVKPGSFKPPPKVESCFVGLRRRARPGSKDEYRQMVAVAELAFTHRRKTLTNALRGRFDREHVTGWCTQAGLPANIRPEQLSLEQYRSLAKALQTAAASPSE